MGEKEEKKYDYMYGEPRLRGVNHSPLIRSFFTDISSSLLQQQQWGRCAFFEMRFMECLEAYGADRGLMECELQRRDFEECVTGKYQEMRVIAMQKERLKQAKYKKLTKEQMFLEPPPKDAFTFIDNN